MSKHPDVLKECSVHGLTAFATYVEGGKYTRHRCKKCQVDKITLLVRKRKQQLVDYKGGKCEICGYSKSIAAMQFHHVDPSDKSFTIGQKTQSYSIDKLKEEADKCIMICANCHFELHADSEVSIRKNAVI